MANILILGDTWGTVPCHLWPRGEKEVAEWFEYQFLKRGHPTFNKSWGGNQNNYQFHQAETFLYATKDTTMAPDIIIWFHTELVRDLTPNETQMFEELGYDAVIDITADRMYNWATKIKNDYPNIKWAIMGGHAPLYEPKKYLLDWADFRIDNLRAKILGQDIPASQAFEFLEKGKGSLWDWPGISEDVIQRELAIKEQIIELTKDVSKFYNQKHPGVGPFKSLAQEIIEHFNL